MQNVICITGRIARDPELRRTNSGKAVTSFSVACISIHAPRVGSDSKDAQIFLLHLRQKRYFL